MVRNQGIDWYIKWVATAIIIVAVLCRAVDEVPKVYDVILSVLVFGGGLEYSGGIEH